MKPWSKARRLAWKNGEAPGWETEWRRIALKAIGEIKKGTRRYPGCVYEQVAWMPGGGVYLRQADGGFEAFATFLAPLAMCPPYIWSEREIFRDARR